MLFTFYGAQLHPTATHRFKGIQERQFYRMEMDSFLGTPWEFLSLSYLSASLCVPDWAFSLQMTSSRRQGGGNSLLQLFTYTVWVPLWCLLIKFQGRADKPEFYQMSVLGTISMFEKGAQASFPTEDGIFCFKRWIKFWENSRLGGGIQKTKKVIIDYGVGGDRVKGCREVTPSLCEFMKAIKHHGKEAWLSHLPTTFPPYWTQKGWFLLEAPGNMCFLALSNC